MAKRLNYSGLFNQIFRKDENMIVGDNYSWPFYRDLLPPMLNN
jgi:hypothetical protein